MMKTVFIILSSAFCVLIIMVALQSCSSESGPGCGDYYFDKDNNVDFMLVDKEGTNLLHISNFKFDKDSVKIFNDDWSKELYPGKGGFRPQGGWISFTFIREADEGITNNPITHKYFLYLNHKHIDTLVFDFEMSPLKCGDPDLSYLKITYDDSVYFDGPTDQPRSLTFLSN